MTEDERLERAEKLKSTIDGLVAELGKILEEPKRRRQKDANAERATQLKADLAKAEKLSVTSDDNVAFTWNLRRQLRAVEPEAPAPVNEESRA